MPTPKENVFTLVEKIIQPKKTSKNIEDRKHKTHMAAPKTPPPDTRLSK